MKVIVTGASGVLGKATHIAYKAAHYDVTGLAYLRATDHLERLDLTNFPETEAFFEITRPDWVIHCAAERRPGTQPHPSFLGPALRTKQALPQLNVDVCQHLAELGMKLKFTLIYISTDYVFDGTSPPYLPSSVTNPVNFYGKTKRDGELAVLGVQGADSVVLRVPVLYGPVSENSESAINILLDIVQDQSGKQYKMDHYATRYPTNVVDIANFLVRLTTANLSLIPPILHYSAPEPYTKFEICLVFSGLLGMPIDHITPDADEPTGAAAVSRPRDCQLYTRETEDLMESVGGLGTTGFEEWWARYLGVNKS
ncbi:NAD-P-binding protein [Thelephora ganbajun]|uniref:NAD-P-binding protein n=1 Tax=Thelephora ganbajun TaxID=370292 RepID=A0ACB6ZS15_THEGA|nr:NAD-P-binding protein [Thelephora ganbajun]